MATALVSNVVRGRQEPDRLLLLVHGKGADEHDLEPLVPYLDPEGRFLTVLPRAPIPIMGGWQWYETVGIPRGGPQLTASVDALDDLLESACAEYGFERSQAVVAGFSQGCALTLALGLRRSDRPRPAGLVAMSGFLPEPDGLDYDFAGAPPVLVQHGTEDPVISVGYGRRTVARLGAEGACPSSTGSTRWATRSAWRASRTPWPGWRSCWPGGGRPNRSRTSTAPARPDAGAVL
jgi:phospholipase/carboxylesterase